MLFTPKKMHYQSYKNAPYELLLTYNYNIYPRVVFKYMCSCPCSGNAHLLENEMTAERLVER